ncbi:hypothetical protein HII36_52165, partial [Nonomuraea sp. NN258]|uniref:hypothetical protein n=1 Tax=Nonomuraea antri TaxID=2730852 RepID=UPI001567D3D6
PPATTRPPTQAPTTAPPNPGRGPLVSISVSVSADLPLLGGDGDGLLDLDLDLGIGLGSSLLGALAVPGSVLLGRHLVVRRTRRPRGKENP